jgi:YD repeat-containing protein
MHPALFIMLFLVVSVPAVAQVQEPDGILSSAHDHLTAADPFDVGTGIYYREYRDLYVEDTIPIDFSRNQRNMDPRSRSFGIGGMASYDMFIIGDVEKFSWVALVGSNGEQDRYERVSPGTSFASAVFENKTSLNKFFGSRIEWKRTGGWRVSLRDGSKYSIRGCAPNSKPGLCAVTEIKNAQGERLTIDRDRDGNILKITSPHGHTVSIEHDSEDRITKATDDAGHWVKYEYDESGALKKAVNWSGERQTFRYDKNFNMISAHEFTPAAEGHPACDVIVKNWFDAKSRFAGQKVSNGMFASVTYATAADGGMREVRLHSDQGFTHFFLNEAGYELREDFTPRGKGTKWSLRRIRDPQTNAVTDLRLRCAGSETKLPIKLDGTLQKSEFYIPYFTRYCSEVASKGNPQPKPVSRVSPDAPSEP